MFFVKGYQTDWSTKNQLSLSMDPRQIRKRAHNTTEASNKNAKQRQTYHNMPKPEKNKLLLERRLKKREATTQRLLEDTTSSNPVERILGNTGSSNLAEPIYVNQDTFDIGCSSSASKTVDAHLSEM